MSNYIVQKPVGTNGHFIRAVPGRLEIVQYAAPQCLNEANDTTTVMPLSIKDIERLSSTAVSMTCFFSEEKPALTEPELICDGQLRFRKCIINNKKVIKLENVSQNLGPEIEEKAQLILKNEDDVTELFEAVWKCTICMLLPTPLQSFGLFQFFVELSKINNADRINDIYCNWFISTDYKDEKQKIMCKIFDSETKRNNFNMFFMVNYSTISICFKLFMIFNNDLHSDIEAYIIE